MNDTIAMHAKPHIIRLDTVDSTNTYLRDNPSLWRVPYCTVTARVQTAGRGRASRSWHMSPGLDLAFSTLFLLPAESGDLSCLTLHAGLAVHRALRAYCGAALNLKWPNDICHEHKKIGGILCEAVRDGSSSAVIIGIGVNVNSTHFPEEIRGRATSLKCVTGRSFEIDSLLNEILDTLIPTVRDFRSPMEHRLFEEWIASSNTIGSEVAFINDGREERGTITAVNPDGSVDIAAGGNAIHGYRGDVFFAY